jgi:lipopolysaccharide cholinephosphotransferase
MKKESFWKYIFSVDTTSSNRIIIYFLGIRIRHLKKSIKNSGLQYVKLDCPITEIPPATGKLRQIQLDNLEGIEFFDKICAQHGLQYWLDFGNLLGAVRHKGFIPWDDDVDFGMMRQDYEKFIELFENGFPNNDKYYIKFNNNGKDKCFVKVVNKDLPHVAMDIFPYDYYFKKTTTEEKLSLTEFLRKFTHKKYYKLLYPFFINNPKGMRKRLFNLRDKKILKGNTPDIKSQPSLFYGIDYSHNHKILFVDYETIFPIKKIYYEGKYFSCPNDEDSLLKAEYGDYMKLPNDCYPRHSNTEN